MEKLIEKALSSAGSGPGATRLLLQWHGMHAPHEMTAFLQYCTSSSHTFNVGLKVPHTVLSPK